MSNTVIQLKYSTSNSAPGSLNIGEPAYSFSSGKLFIGNTTNHVLTIGGKYYVDEIEASTSANTGNTLVRRDPSGNASFKNVTAEKFFGALVGNVDTATKLATARDIGLAGDATGNVSFDGSANVTITVDLTNTGVTPATYGGASQVPTFVVDEEGRITSAANVSISTSFNIAGDSGTGTVAGGETLTIVGRDGITTVGVDANNSILVDVDNTVVRTSGNQTISGDLAITGNLIVSGNTITQDVETLVVEDSLIQLAANNAADAVDIGFFGQYNDGGTKYTALVRDASDSGKYKLLTAGSEKPSAANTVNTAAFSRATLDANITGGTVSGLSAAIAIADGGTNANSFSTGQITYFDGTKLNSLANTGTAGTYANASHVPVITTDAYGRVSAVTNTAIAISASQVTSGTLSLARGGTNQTSYTAGALLINDGTSIASLANTTYTQTGTLATSNTVSAISVDAYGRLTALTSSAIALAAGQITSGTLDVARGGSGAGTHTQNGVLLGNGTSAFQTASSATEGHVLTINASGAPVFSMISGGTF